MNCFVYKLMSCQLACFFSGGTTMGTLQKHGTVTSWVILLSILTFSESSRLSNAMT